MGTLHSDQLPVAPGIVEYWVPETTTDCEAIRFQLYHLLASPLFSGSKRYTNLLKYVVEQTLSAKGAGLKERTLGIEVFGRDLTYDTNQDPVVRISAAKVRDRIAQYYLQPGHEPEIRIELLPGSYIPLFRRATAEHDDPPPAEVTSPALDEAELSSLAEEPIVDPRTNSALLARHEAPRLWRYAALSGIICLIAVGWVFRTRLVAPDPVSQFWGPVWDNASALVICVPGKFPSDEAAAQTSASTAAVAPLSIKNSLRHNSIAWPDATALYALVGFVQSHGHGYQVRRSGDTALSDLRTGPVVLIGGLNNKWLLLLSGRYRFSYKNDPDAGEAWIQDTQNPSLQDWKVAWHSPYSGFEEDYGIVSRVWDPTTERLVVTASGIASYGTIAAAEFLTNPKYLEMIAQRAPKGWEKKSLQVVFATKVFNGNAGPPRILAVHVW